MYDVSSALILGWYTKLIQAWAASGFLAPTGITYESTQNSPPSAATTYSAFPFVFATT